MSSSLIFGLFPCRHLKRVRKTDKSTLQYTMRVQFTATALEEAGKFKSRTFWIYKVPIDMLPAFVIPMLFRQSSDQLWMWENPCSHNLDHRDLLILYKIQDKDILETLCMHWSPNFLALDEAMCWYKLRYLKLVDPIFYLPVSSLSRYWIEHPFYIMPAKPT